MSGIYEEMENYRLDCCKANSKIEELEAENEKLREELERIQPLCCKEDYDLIEQVLKGESDG